MFILKYSFRLIHILSYGIFMGLLINDAFINNHSKGNKFNRHFIPQGYHVLLGIFFLISGFVNMIILLKENKYKRDFHLTLWKYLLYTKTCLFILLTPLFDNVIFPMVYSSQDNEYSSHLKAKMKLVIFLVGLLVSPFTRYYRETFLTKLKLD